MLFNSCGQPPRHLDVDVNDDDVEVADEATMNEDVIKKFWEKATEFTVELMDDNDYDADASQADIYNKAAKTVNKIEPDFVFIALL